MLCCNNEHMANSREEGATRAQVLAAELYAQCSLLIAVKPFYKPLSHVANHRHLVQARGTAQHVAQLLDAVLFYRRLTPARVLTLIRFRLRIAQVAIAGPCGWPLPGLGRLVKSI